ncbi:MAG TPA: RidA family protein [Thermoflexia bacterium]|nr:RidA family protein [Thermoflexia bacterium]
MRKVIATSAAPAAVGPYSQAIKTEQLVFTAGQLGLDPVTGEFAGEDITAQTQQAMQNLQAVIQAAGSDMEHVLKTTIYMVDLADFKTVNAIYGKFFTQAPPARSTVQVAALPLGGLVEIEAIALLLA